QIHFDCCVCLPWCSAVSQPESSQRDTPGRSWVCAILNTWKSWHRGSWPRVSVRASEEAVVLLNRGDSVNVSRATTKVSPEFLAVAERLGDRLDTKVNISVGKRKGKLSVEFANQEDLDRILGLLGIDDQDGI